MRGALFALSIPALLLAGAAEADTAPARQCPAPWVQTSNDRIRVDSGVYRLHKLTRSAYTDTGGLENHVLSKAEARAELDAIKITPAKPVLVASQGR